MELDRTIERLERKVDGVIRQNEQRIEGPRLRYSKERAAFLLDCSSRHLKTLEDVFGLQSYVERGKRYYTHAELERFVASQQGKAAASMADTFGEGAAYGIAG